MSMWFSQNFVSTVELLLVPYPSLAEQLRVQPWSLSPLELSCMRVIHHLYDNCSSWLKQLCSMGMVPSAHNLSSTAWLSSSSADQFVCDRVLPELLWVHFSRLPSTLSPSQVLAKKKFGLKIWSHSLISPIASQRKSILRTSYNQWRFPLETLMLFGKIVNAKTLMPCCPNAKKRYIIGVFGGSVDTFFVWKCLDGLKMRCLLTKT